MKQQSKARASPCPPEAAWPDRASAAWPRRRDSDAQRIDPFRRLAYEVLALALCLPLLLWQLSGQTGLWQANAFVYDQLLEARGAAPGGGVVQVWLDEPCTPHGCAALPMRYREALRLLAGHRPAAVWVEASALSDADRQALVSWLVAQAIPNPPAVRLLSGDWLRPDRDGTVRGVVLDLGHPLWPALGASPSQAPGWLGWPWASASLAPEGLSYAGLLLGQYQASALHGHTVVLGPRFPTGSSGPWLVRSGAAGHVLSRTDALAQSIAALRQQHFVRAIGPGPMGWWLALPLWLLMLLTWRWPEALAAWVLLLSSALLGLSWAALVLKGWWWPVATPVAGLLLFQMVWSWRRGRALSQVFGRRIERIEKALADAPQDLDPRGLRPGPGQARRHLSRMQVLDQTLARLEAQHQIQRRMQRQRDRWLAFLSHDLRAPQSNILSLLELRQEGVDGMDDQRFYGSLRLQVERTLRLAEGFVDLLRAESDRLNLQHCSLSALAVEAVDRCWPQARTRQVRIEQRSTGEDEGLLLADPELITRALVNLLNNAVRHCAAGGQVTLCVAHDAGGGQWLCTVRDDGEGLDEARLAQLLQAMDGHAGLRSGPVSGRARGLGLGLLVARTVVSRHGGELSAWSAPGQGCTFAIALPVAPREPQRGGAQALSSGSPAAATRALPA